MFHALKLLPVLCLFAACSSNPEPETPRAPVKLGEPSDNVDPKVIHSAVRVQAGRFAHCYESAREMNPSLQGRIEVRFLINPDGSVGQAMAFETDLPSPVADCVVNVFYALVLPAQHEATIAQYPMFFNPS